jgi:2-polyprenyl-3-methyl-5-hydroxy-6-metoxy-1,4-benzoquinol methylase
MSRLFFVKKYRGRRRRGRGHRVLDLGCGHGLPGLVALQRGAAVDFLDYNREVRRPLRPCWRPF